MSFSRKFPLILGGIFFLMSALQIVRFFNQPADIWWTPKTLSVPLADASDRLEVFLRDVALLEHIKGGRVQLLTDTGAATVTEADMRLRFNNWDRIRAERIPALLGNGIVLGATGGVVALRYCWLGSGQTGAPGRVDGPVR